MSNYLTGLNQLNPQVKRHNGGTATLTLDKNGTTNATMLYVNGVTQTPGIDFNVSGTTLTCTSTLPAGTNIATTIQYFNTGIVNTPADATVTNAKTNFVSTSSAAGLQIKGDGTTDGTLQLNCSQNSHGIKIKSPPHSASASYTLTMPNDDGDPNEFLQTNGSGVLDWASAGGGAWTFISSVTASNSASVAFTGLDATYDRYWITFASIVPQNDNTQIYMQMGTGSTPTYDTGTNYTWQAAGYMESASSWSFGIITGQAYIKIGYSFSLGTATGEHCHGDLYLVDPANTSNYTSTFSKIWGPQQSSSRLTYDQVMGMLEVQTAVTAIKFYMDSGNIASGTFRLYGLNKA